MARPYTVKGKNGGSITVNASDPQAAIDNARQQGFEPSGDVAAGGHRGNNVSGVTDYGVNDTPQTFAGPNDAGNRSNNSNPFSPTTKGPNMTGDPNNPHDPNNPNNLVKTTDPSQLFYKLMANLGDGANYKSFGDTTLGTQGMNVFDPSNPGRAFSGALQSSGINTLLPNAGQGFFRGQEDLVNRLFPVLSALYPGQYGRGDDPRAMANFLGVQGGGSGLPGQIMNLTDPKVAAAALNKLLFGENGQVNLNPLDASDPSGAYRFALESNPQMMAQTIGALGSAGKSPFVKDAVMSFVANLVNSIYSNPGALQANGGQLLQAVARQISGQ